MSTFSFSENICLEHILLLRKKLNYHTQLILLENNISDSSTKWARTDDSNTLKTKNVPIKTEKKYKIWSIQ